LISSHGWQVGGYVLGVPIPVKENWCPYAQCFIFLKRLSSNGKRKYLLIVRKVSPILKNRTINGSLLKNCTLIGGSSD
jgi:hypothetical protein